MTKIENLGIEEALAKLAEAFPLDERRITIYHGWCGDPNAIRTHARIERDKNPDDIPSLTEWGNTPAEVADACISKAGERNPQYAKLAKIAALRAQIAKLEGETK